MAPDPYGDEEMYKRWLLMYCECYKLLAAEFPEIAFWECGNEYDWYGFMHQNIADKVEAYPEQTTGLILADLCYAARKGVHSVAPEAKIVLPGFTTAECGFHVFGYMYEAIESKHLPTIEAFDLTDPDEYFDILAWHPYGEGKVEQTREICNNFHSVAEAHGDGEKAVWLTEIGCTEVMKVGDGKDLTQVQQEVAETMAGIFRMAREDMPGLETIFIFRYTSCLDPSVNDYESRFGIFYSPYDDVNHGKPKPVAIAIYKYLYGENADVSPLYWYSKNFGITEAEDKKQK